MKDSPVKEPDERRPFVTVVVPVYNDRHRIGLCLEAILNQDYPSDRYEVIVADNGSTDGTREVVERFPVRLVAEERRGSYAARNRGIAAGRGSILAFTDSDAVVDRRWLSEGVSALQTENAAYACSRVRMFVGERRPNLLALMELHFIFDVEHSLRTRHAGPTVGVFVTRDAIDRVGHFDDRLFSGGDMEFGRRVYDAGFRQTYAPKSVVYHPVRAELRGWLSRSFRYGQGRMDLSRLHPDRFEPPLRCLLQRREFLPPNPFRIWKVLDRRPLLFPHRRSRARARRLDPGRRIVIYTMYYLHKCAFYAGMVWRAFVAGR